MNSSPLLALVLAAAGLLVTGCRQKVDNPPPSVETGERADNPVAARDFDYWGVISPLVAGTYDGQCQRLPEPTRSPGAFVVAPDGQVTVGDFSETMRNGEIKIARTIQNGVMTHHVEANDGQLRIFLVDAGSSSGVGTTMTREDKVVTCEKAAQALGLRSQRIYPLFAKMVEAPSEDFKCFDPVNASQSAVPFKFDDGVLTIGTDRFDFKAAQQETAAFSRGLNRVEYHGFLANEQTVHFELDEQGKLRRFGAMARDKKPYMCELK